MKLVYLAEPKYGGWVTFTAHLALALADQGIKAPILKAGKPGKAREFSHGLNFQSTDPSVLQYQAKDCLITALDKHNLPLAEQMLMGGAALVLHDPNEFHPTIFKILVARGNSVITIRKTVQRALEKHGIKSTVIPHPFKKLFHDQVERSSHACSYSRVDFDKHTEIIIEANKSLGFREAVKIYGAMNRMYEYVKLRGIDPDWQRNYYGTFPLDETAAERIAAKNKFTIDLSVIKNDGGGTQYTFLEAWAQGSHLIVSRKWLLPDDIMQDGVNCTAVADAGELRAALSKGPSAEIIERAGTYLAAHASARVVPSVLAALRP